MVDVDTMAAGREMDALVAEKVLDLHWKGEWPHYSTDIAAAMEVLDAVSKFRSGTPPINDMPHPTDGNRKDARLAFYKPVVELHWYEHDDQAHVVIGRCKGTGSEDDIVVCEWGGSGDTMQTVLARAICRAALKAVKA